MSISSDGVISFGIAVLPIYYFGKKKGNGGTEGYARCKGIDRTYNRLARQAAPSHLRTQVLNRIIDTPQYLTLRFGNYMAGSRSQQVAGGWGTGARRRGEERPQHEHESTSERPCEDCFEDGPVARSMPGRFLIVKVVWITVGGILITCIVSSTYFKLIQLLLQTDHFVFSRESIPDCDRIDFCTFASTN